MDSRTPENLIIEYLLNEDNSAPVNPELANWIAQSEANSLIFARYKKIWQRLPYATRQDQFDEVRAFERVDEMNQRQDKLRRRMWNWGYTLSGVAVTLLFLLLINQLFPVNEKPFSVVVDYGSRSEVVLPDGSHVKLNAGSHITYQYKNKEDIREVIFEGEGFFHVAKSDKPFLIRTTGGVEVGVLGTTFNLSAYTDDPEIRVSLVEGRVKIQKDKDKLILSPGQMAAVSKSEGNIRLETGILSHSYGWLNKRLYLDNLSLTETCKILERWYDVDISLDKNTGNKIHYTGVLQEESITDILDALCSLSEIKYRISGKKIDVSPK